MILSSDELEILDYLKSWDGKFVTMMEICRCAGGRKKYREDANWAKCMMSRLVDAKMVEVNDRGHYRTLPEKGAAKKSDSTPKSDSEQFVGVCGDDYFPTPRKDEFSGENYFPEVIEPEPMPAPGPAPERWVSPQVAEILAKSGKKFGRHK